MLKFNTESNCYEYEKRGIIEDCFTREKIPFGIRARITQQEILAITNTPLGGKSFIEKKFDMEFERERMKLILTSLYKHSVPFDDKGLINSLKPDPISMFRFTTMIKECVKKCSLLTIVCNPHCFNILKKALYGYYRETESQYGGENDVELYLQIFYYPNGKAYWKKVNLICNNVLYNEKRILLYDAYSPADFCCTLEEELPNDFCMYAYTNKKTKNIDDEQYREIKQEIFSDC